MEKFLVGLGTTRVIVTNNWIILIDTWSVHLINQRDAVLCVSGVDTYDRSSSGLLETQYVNIRVASVTNPMQPFTLRINSLLFVDLLSKLTAPIHHVTDLNIPVKIEDRFQIIFERTANSNMRYDQTQWQAEECCIGCFQSGRRRERSNALFSVQMPSDVVPSLYGKMVRFQTRFSEASKLDYWQVTLPYMSCSILLERFLGSVLQNCMGIKFDGSRGFFIRNAERNGKM
ncbi:E3 ubiquitin-protein ligase [Trichinella spiralis]|uniref:E3 ubiquitin-protein ligase n=1 Tax=Trichinella spiralis TaxID=6334 RepID=A0ABR3KR73_TRISP